MDLYLTRTRRTRVPIGVTMLAVLGMIVWAFTAQGRAAASSASCPAENACKLESYVATWVEDDADDDDLDADGRDSDGGSDSDSSGHGGGGKGSDSGGDSSGDGKTHGSSHGGTSGHGGGGGSDSGGDSSGDGGSGGSSHGGTTGQEPPTEEPPNNPPNNPPSNPPNNAPGNPPRGGVLPGSGGPPVVVLPDTAAATEGGAPIGLLAGLGALGVAGIGTVRRLARVDRRVE